MPFFFIFLRAACRRAVLPTPYSPSRATEFIHNPSRILKTKVVLDYAGTNSDSTNVRSRRVRVVLKANIKIIKIVTSRLEPLFPHGTCIKHTSIKHILANKIFLLPFFLLEH